MALINGTAVQPNLPTFVIGRSVVLPQDQFARMQIQNGFSPLPQYLNQRFNVHISEWDDNTGETVREYTVTRIAPNEAAALPVTGQAALLLNLS